MLVQIIKLSGLSFLGFDIFRYDGGKSSFDFGEKLVFLCFISW